MADNFSIIDFIITNCDGDFSVDTVESLKNFMPDPDHRLVSLQARLRLRQPTFDALSSASSLPDHQLRRAKRFLAYVQSIVPKSSWHLLDWIGISRYFHSFVMNESEKKLNPVVIIQVYVWLKVTTFFVLISYFHIYFNFV